MGIPKNPFFGRIAALRAHSFLVYLTRYASSFAARLLALYPEILNFPRFPNA